MLKLNIFVKIYEHDDKPKSIIFISVKSTNDVQTKEVVVGVVTDMDLLQYVTNNEGTKLLTISENSGTSTNSGNSSPEPIE